MKGKNCWEHFSCGREPDGNMVHELGVCPAANFEGAHGFLNGKNGGRACAYVAGTFCSGTIQGTAREKEKNCIKCEFYNHLRGHHRDEMSLPSFFDYVKT